MHKGRHADTDRTAKKYKAGKCPYNHDDSKRENSYPPPPQPPWDIEKCKHHKICVGWMQTGKCCPKIAYGNTRFRPKPHNKIDHPLTPE